MNVTIFGEAKTRFNQFSRHVVDEQEDNLDSLGCGLCGQATIPKTGLRMTMDRHRASNVTHSPLANGPFNVNLWPSPSSFPWPWLAGMLCANDADSNALFISSLFIYVTDFVNGDCGSNPGAGGQYDVSKKA